MDKKIDIDAFIAVLKAQALRNDGIISGDERYILDTVDSLDIGSAYKVYLAVLVAAYKDKKITEDEGDLVRMARDILKIDSSEHQRALTELDL